MVSCEFAYPPAEVAAPVRGILERDAGKFILGQLVEDGFANLSLNPEQRDIMFCLEEAGRAFFSQSIAEKTQYRGPNEASGYRLPGAAYTQNELTGVKYLDYNDSLVLRKGAEIPNRNSPNAGSLRNWEEAMEAFQREIAIPAVDTVLAALNRKFDYKHLLPYDEGTVWQSNSYRTEDDRPRHGIEGIEFKEGSRIFQEEHDDGNWLTVLKGSHPGLVVWRKKGGVPIVHGTDTVTIFGGSILEIATRGYVKRCVHTAFDFLNNSQIENDEHRIVNTCFMSPNAPKGSVVPAYYDQNFNMADIIRNGPSKFGLTDFTDPDEARGGSRLEEAK